MKNNALAETTIHSTAKRLSLIARNVDINNPEAVKNFIANRKCSAGYKATLCQAYGRYARFNKIDFATPKNKTERRHVTIPTREKLQMLIAHARPKMKIKLMISLECGLRPVELCNLRLKDVDLDNRQIHPTTAKHGTPRTLKISLQLQAMFKEYLSKTDMKPDDRLFPIDARVTLNCSA